MNYTRLLRGAGLVAILTIVVTVIAWPDLQSTVRADDTGFASPTDVHTPIDWVNPTRGFTSNDSYTTTTIDLAMQGYSDFGFEVPTGAFILGIAVRLEAFSSDDEGCDLQVRLSWDGTTYTPLLRNANLTDSEQIHTLGGSSDDWGRDWVSSDFDDDNFVARVTNVGEDIGCLAASTAELDHIQVNVYFKSLTETSLEPPKATAEPDQWDNADEAFDSDDTYATADADDSVQAYADFNLSVPDPALIVGIEVLIEARSEDPDGCQIQVRISGGDAGPPVSAYKTEELTDEDADYTFGGPDDPWDREWTAESFSDEDFVLEVRNHDPGSECTGGSEAFLDFVAVKVYYKPLEQSGKTFPSATHEPNGWTDAELAFADDDQDAVGENGDDEQGYSGFDLDVPDASIIMGISVQVDASSEDTAGCDLLVELSGTGGAPFTAPMTIDLTNVQTTTEVGGDLDLWGVTTWTAASFNDDNFVVRLTNDDTDGDCADDSDVLVDFLQVNVVYKEINEEGFSPPSATHEPNQWTDADNAFTSDDEDATSTTHADEQGYSDFGFSIDESAAITGVEVRVEVSSEDGTGCELDVRLSWNDGDSYTSAKTIELTNLQSVHTLGSSEDTWGRGWIGSDFDNDNFVVKVENIDNDCDPVNTFLDFLEVNVYFKTATPAATDTPTETDTPEFTNTPEDTATATITATPTITPTGTATATPTITLTPTITDTPTATDTPTVTDTPTNTPTPTKALGDVNDDGEVDSVDALLILQYDARLIKSLPNSTSADVNEDDTINAVDANLILQFVAGFISQLPP